jgi:hypothetical protein
MEAPSEVSSMSERALRANRSQLVSTFQANRERRRTRNRPARRAHRSQFERQRTRPPRPPTRKSF